VRQLPGHAVPCASFAAAPPTPALITAGGFDDPARQHRPTGFESLPGHLKPKLIQAAERRQISTAETRISGNRGSVRHVEVSGTRRVGTLILGTAPALL
jgi:hypothetical protein